MSPVRRCWEGCAVKHIPSRLRDSSGVWFLTKPSYDRLRLQKPILQFLPLYLLSSTFRSLQYSFRLVRRASALPSVDSPGALAAGLVACDGDRGGICIGTGIWRWLAATTRTKVKREAMTHSIFNLSAFALYILLFSSSFRWNVASIVRWSLRRSIGQSSERCALCGAKQGEDSVVLRNGKNGNRRDVAVAWHRMAIPVTLGVTRRTVLVGREEAWALAIASGRWTYPLISFLSWIFLFLDISTDTLGQLNGTFFAIMTSRHSVLACASAARRTSAAAPTSYHVPVSLVL